MNEGVITDEAMKEMADQLKEKYDEIMMKNLKHEVQNKDLKKDLMSLYGLLRIIDNMTNDEYEIDPHLEGFISLARSMASAMIDEHFFSSI